MDLTIESKSETIAYSEEERTEQLDQDDPTASQQSQLERFISLVAAIAFQTIMQSGWESVATTFQFALLNGGPAAMIYGGILAGFGASFVAMSLAELASIDPMVGAQYRWSARFAPFAPRFWALLQGWLTIFAWIVSVASVPANLANIVTAIIIFNKDDYVYHSWHTTLLMWIFIIAPWVFNIYFRYLLNMFQLVGIAVHVVFFIASIIVLTVLAQRSTNEFVWQTLVDNVSGWKNPVIAFGIGVLTMAYPIAGGDAVLHLSAEVKKVRTRAPYSIITATISNAIMQWGYAICILYTIGNVGLVTSSDTGLPLIEVMYLATNSKAVATVFVVAVAIVLFVALFNAFASVSRLTWAFARDHGLPFSSTFAKVHPRSRMPVNALALISVISFLLSFIYIGSSTAFDAIIALSAFGLHVSYICPILFFLIWKLRGKAEMGPFSLGKWGIAINFLSLGYLLFVVIWMPFPTMLPVTGENMNYAGPVFLIILFGALLDWVISGHKRFQVPVAPTHLEY